MRPAGSLRAGPGTAGWICAAVVGFVLASGPAAAQAEGNNAAPPKSMTVKIMTRAPDTEKWTAATSADHTKRVFTCKPLACSSPATVFFIFGKGLPKPPSPEWLENFAAIDLPKIIRAKGAADAVMHNRAERIETLFSKTATLKTYPAALNETRITNGTAVVYVEIAIIFAGPIIVRVESKSPSQDIAKNSLQGFIQELQIVETPGLPPGTPVPPRNRAPKNENL
jgi:hypothetical protein